MLLILLVAWRGSRGRSLTLIYVFWGASISLTHTGRAGRAYPVWGEQIPPLSTRAGAMMLFAPPAKLLATIRLKALKRGARVEWSHGPENPMVKVATKVDGTIA